MNESKVSWGVPTKSRTRKTEKFLTPVLTLSALLKPSAGRKMSFNTAAQELLGLVSGESTFAMGFDPHQNIFIKVSPDGNFKITKTFSVSDKKTYEYIAKLKDFDVNVDNHLTIEPVDGEEYFQVSGIVSEGEMGSETVEEEEMPVLDEPIHMNAPEEEEELVEEMDASDVDDDDEF